MNIEQIEKILRNPPPIKTPPGLSEKLNADIQLPRVPSVRPDWVAPTPWFKRWMPALSFITIFLVCLVAIAVQTNLISGLRHDNKNLRSQQGDLDALRAENAQVQTLRLQNQELDRLRKDNLELQQLRDEIARLSGQVSNLMALRAENEQLRSMIAARRNPTEPDDLSLAKEEARAERIKCVNNLKQIGLGARMWAADNNDVYPSNFISMSNYLVNPIVLHCPSDKSRTITNWDDVAAGNVSYIMDAPGISEANANVIFVECPIHHNICLEDGSVQQLSPDGNGGWGIMSGYGQIIKQIKVIDGLKTLAP